MPGFSKSTCVVLITMNLFIQLVRSQTFPFFPLSSRGCSKVSNKTAPNSSNDRRPVNNDRRARSHHTTQDKYRRCITRYSLLMSGKDNCVFSLDEVRVHNQEEDCWVVVHGRVYDVTSYLRRHPGGYKILFESAGTGKSVSHSGLLITGVYLFT